MTHVIQCLGHKGEGERANGFDGLLSMSEAASL
jgi:hypothetical protein